MKDLVAITNAMTDLIVDADYNELEKFGLKKGTYISSENIDFEKFLAYVSEKEKIIMPGGSPANVACGVRHFGLSAGVISTIGNDETGKAYVKDLEKRGIGHFIDTLEGRSGVCYTLITADGERTFVTDMGVAGKFNINLDVLEDYSLLHTSAYELASDKYQIMNAIEYFHETLKKPVSFDLAAENTVKENLAGIEELIKNVDILFATEQEVKELGAAPWQILCDIVVLKKGEMGSIIYVNGMSYTIPVYRVNVVDMNGAGDAYTAGFLSGKIMKYFTIRNCGELGSVFAGQICARRGARI